VIIDTSALVAVLKQEAGSRRISDALADGNGMIPSPVLVEFRRVSAPAGNEPHVGATRLLAELAGMDIVVEPFTARDAAAAIDANPIYGTGNGRGGLLNMLDLMVYAVAKRTGRPILCTGRDFAATDALIHPASRID
jgi:ribonuclease VapC